MKKRNLTETPFDKVFEVEKVFDTETGETVLTSELCHSTGVEVCFEGEDPSDPANWWNQYVDSNGSFHYGR